MNRFKKNLGFNLGLILLGAAFLAGLAMAYLAYSGGDETSRALRSSRSLLLCRAQGEADMFNVLLLVFGEIDGRKLAAQRGGSSLSALCSGGRLQGRREQGADVLVANPPRLAALVRAGRVRLDDVRVIHGGRTPPERRAAMASFRRGEGRVLVDPNAWAADPAGGLRTLDAWVPSPGGTLLALTQQRDHLEQRIAGSQSQVLAFLGTVIANRQPGGGHEVVRRGPLRRREIARVRKAGKAHLSSSGLARQQPKAHDSACAYLDGGDAAFGIALRIVGIAVTFTVDTSGCERLISLMNDLKTKFQERMGHEYLRDLVWWHKSKRLLSHAEWEAALGRTLVRWSQAGHRRHQVHTQLSPGTIQLVSARDDGPDDDGETVPADSYQDLCKLAEL
jgi:hypothetical protein